MLDFRGFQFPTRDSWNLSWTGPVDLSGCYVTNELRFEDCELTRLRLNDANVGKVIVFRSHIDDIELDSCMIREESHIIACRIRRLSANRARFFGDFGVLSAIMQLADFSETECTSRLSLDSSDMGHVSLDGFRAQGITMSSTHVQGRLMLRANDVSLDLRDSSLNILDIERTTFSRIVIEDSKIREINGESTQLQGRIARTAVMFASFEYARILGEFRIEDVRAETLPALSGPRRPHKAFHRVVGQYISPEPPGPLAEFDSDDLRSIKFGSILTSRTSPPERAALEVDWNLPFLSFRAVAFETSGLLSFIGREDDLSMANIVLLHSDATRCTFDRVTWRTIASRAAVFEETFLIRRDLSQRFWRSRRGDDEQYWWLPGGVPLSDSNPEHVARLYRGLRASYEERLQFHEAGDFFVGEMEMRRVAPGFGASFPLLLRRWFTLMGAYSVLSRYGQSYRRALLWIVLTIAGFATWNLASAGWDVSPDGIFSAVARSGLAFLSIEQTAIGDQLEGRLAIVLIALFVLAVRQRLMRHSAYSE